MAQGVGDWENPIVIFSDDEDEGNNAGPSQSASQVTPKPRSRSKGNGRASVADQDAESVGSDTIQVLSYSTRSKGAGDGWTTHIEGMERPVSDQQPDPSSPPASKKHIQDYFPPSTQATQLTQPTQTQPKVAPDEPIDLTWSESDNASDRHDTHSRSSSRAWRLRPRSWHQAEAGPGPTSSSTIASRKESKRRASSHRPRTEANDIEPSRPSTPTSRAASPHEEVDTDALPPVGTWTNHLVVDSMPESFALKRARQDLSKSPYRKVKRRKARYEGMRDRPRRSTESASQPPPKRMGATWAVASPISTSTLLHTIASARGDRQALTERLSSMGASTVNSGAEADEPMEVAIDHSFLSDLNSDDEGTVKEGDIEQWGPKDKMSPRDASSPEQTMTAVSDSIPGVHRPLTSAVEQAVEDVTIGVDDVTLDSAIGAAGFDLDRLHASDDEPAEVERSLILPPVPAEKWQLFLNHVQNGFDAKGDEEFLETSEDDQDVLTEQVPERDFWGIVNIKIPPPSEQPIPERRGVAKREVDTRFLDEWAAKYPNYDNPGIMRLLFESFISQNTIEEVNAPEIRIVNHVDVKDGQRHMGGPPPDFEFQYSNIPVYHPNVPDPELGKGCGCDGPCDPKSKTCSCLKRQELYFYTLDLKGFAYHEDETIKGRDISVWECGLNCGCPPECLNRVIQRGRRADTKIEIVKTKDKGWGVRAASFIPAGRYIGTYSGELITENESERRGGLYEKIGRTYLFDLDGYQIAHPPKGLAAIDQRAADLAQEVAMRAKSLAIEEDEDFDDDFVYSSYSVDAFHYGFTRFFNHSCDPNLVITQAYVTDHHPERPLLVIFSRRDIPIGQEMCISYKGEPDDDLPFQPPIVKMESPPKLKGKGKAKSKTSALVHRTQVQKERDGECKCNAWNCNGQMFSNV